jgi:hypothetical protein
MNMDEVTQNTNQDMDLRKALDISAAGTELIPEVVSAGLRKFVETASPLYAETPKRAWPTNSYIFRSITGLPSADFGVDGGNLPSASTGEYDKPAVPMKYIYTRGEVTGPMIAASASLLDAYQLEIELHADALVRKLEQTIISGDSSGSDEFDGLIKQIDTFVLNKAVGDPAAPVVLTLAHLDEALDAPSQYPTHIIVSRAMGRRLWSLLQAQQRFVDRTEIAGGFRVPTYNDLPIVRVDNDIDDLDNTVLMPDMRWVVMPVNQNVTFEELAKTKDSRDFMLKMYCTLAVEGTSRYHAKLVGVKAS